MHDASAGFHAKPVYRPPLIVYGIALVMWGAIWVAVWSVLP